MNAADIGNGTNHGECKTACPKESDISNIARLNRDQIVAKVLSVSEHY